MRKHYQIAIDGPAGSGKSTVAQLIANKLGFLYIDSGAMYRAVTLYLFKNKLIKKSDSLLKKHLKKMDIQFINKDIQQLVFLNGANVTNKIRSLQVNKLVSEVSAKSIIRKEMVKRQRMFAFYNSVVMDGRDIGTNVFKNADLKIYLTASTLVRAKRRKKDLIKMSEIIKLKDLEKQIQWRDNYDSSRKLSPLCKSQDAVVIDSTDLTVNQVIDTINVFLPFNR